MCLVARGTNGQEQVSSWEKAAHRPTSSDTQCRVCKSLNGCEAEPLIPSAAKSIVAAEMAALRLQDLMTPTRELLTHAVHSGGDSRLIRHSSPGPDCCGNGAICRLVSMLFSGCNTPRWLFLQLCGFQSAGKDDCSRPLAIRIMQDSFQISGLCMPTDGPSTQTVVIVIRSN